MKRFLSVFISIAMVTVLLSACSSAKQNTEDISLKITIDSHYSDMDASAVSAYEKLCNAVINGESEVKFNTQLLDEVTQLFYTSFPLNALVEGISVRSDRTGVDITYKNDAQLHTQLVSDFTARLDEIVAACGGKSVNKNAFIFNAYTYIAKNFTIDNSFVSTYDVLMNGKGAAATINSVLEYVILYNGGEASHVLSTTGKGAILSLVKFNSQYYFFDVGSEVLLTSGNSLKFFAMDTASLERYAQGTFSYTDGAPVENIISDKYSDLWLSESYTASDDNSEVTVDLLGGEKLIVKFE